MSEKYPIHVTPDLKLSKIKDQIGWDQDFTLNDATSVIMLLLEKVNLLDRKLEALDKPASAAPTPSAHDKVVVDLENLLLKKKLEESGFEFDFYYDDAPDVVAFGIFKGVEFTTQRIWNDGNVHYFDGDFEDKFSEDELSVILKVISNEYKAKLEAEKHD